MRILFVYVLLLSTILISCKDKNIAAKLYRKCDKQDKCIRQVNDVTHFKWDKVYIFTVGATLEDIEKVLGISYIQWQDVGDRIIFVDKDKVVYHEEYYPYSEYIEEGSAIFELSKTPYVGQYNTATFSVAKEKNDKGEWYYVVTPIQ